MARGHTWFGRDQWLCHEARPFFSAPLIYSCFKRFAGRRMEESKTRDRLNLNNPRRRKWNQLDGNGNGNGGQAWGGYHVVFCITYNTIRTKYRTNGSRSEKWRKWKLYRRYRTYVPTNATARINNGAVFGGQERIIEGSPPNKDTYILYLTEIVRTFGGRTTGTLEIQFPFKISSRSPLRFRLQKKNDFSQLFAHKLNPSPSITEPRQHHQDRSTIYCTDIIR